MDEQDSKRTERRDISRTNEDGRGQNSFVLPDGREVFNYKNPATIVTVGLVGFVLLIGSTTLIGYRAGRSEVKQIIIETVPNVKLDEDGPTLRRQIYDMGTDIKECKKLEPRIMAVEGWFKPIPKGKR